MATEYVAFKDSRYPGFARCEQPFNDNFATRFLAPEFHREREARIRANQDLLHLHQGITKESVAGKLILKGHWARDLLYLSNIDDANREALRLRDHVGELYETDARLDLPSEVNALVRWEDTFFVRHGAWIYVEDEWGNILATVKIYYFDFRREYAEFKGLDNDKQMALPLERGAHICWFARNEYERWFLYPFWSVKEHEVLREQLVESLGLERQFYYGVPDEYYGISPRKLTQEQIATAIRTHEKFQVGEVSRFTRTRDIKFAGIDFVPFLASGVATLLKSENIRKIKLEANNAPSVRMYDRNFLRSEVVPAFADNGFMPQVFDGGPEDFERMAKREE